MFHLDWSPQGNARSQGHLVVISSLVSMRQASKERKMYIFFISCHVLQHRKVQHNLVRVGKFPLMWCSLGFGSGSYKLALLSLKVSLEEETEMGYHQCLSISEGQRSRGWRQTLFGGAHC